MIRPGIGYIRINRFAQTTGDELEKALTSLRQQGMKSLLLDLRQNFGGLLSQAVEVLDALVPQNKRLVYTRGRIASANADYYSSERAKLADGPIVVLIDHGTASASEIVAGAVQDLDRGLVAGVNSFGKGLVQNQLRLGDGSKLLLTIAKYYTPSGRLIQRPYDKFSDRNEYAEDAVREDVPSDSALAARPKFQTEAGRSVYGGGGIYPDVVLKDGPPLTRPQIEMLQKRVFFEFATHHVASHKDMKWTPQALGKDFALADAVTVVCGAVADSLQRDYGVARDRLRVVPITFTGRFFPIGRDGPIQPYVGAGGAMAPTGVIRTTIRKVTSAPTADEPTIAIAANP